ncbi:hypothetical protein KAJ87_00460 [Candidatus Pacearchaeota archaeon]|nr:hypothetical protein [Candidatus Pacearchaeota archaeon]
MRKSVEELSLEDIKNFEKTLTCVLEDRIWLKLRRLQDYNENIVGVVLYREMFEDDFSLLHAYND